MLTFLYDVSSGRKGRTMIRMSEVWRIFQHIGMLERKFLPFSEACLSMDLN